MKYIKHILIAFMVIGFSKTIDAQLPNRAKKLIGLWEYNKGSGFETWEMEGEELVGHAYRINKIGDTSKVEDLTIRMVNGNMIHLLTTFQIQKDTTIATRNSFLGGKRKLYFENIESNIPHSISYKFGFLNRNKLFIRVKYGVNDEPVKLVLRRL